jgi:hypothetical protein
MRLTMLLPCMLLLTACATTSHVITGTPRAPIDASAVSIYSTAPAAYVEIASIDASSRMSGAFGEQAKMDVVIARLKKEAASLGANGVLLQGTGSEYGGGVGTGRSEPAYSRQATTRPRAVSRFSSRSNPPSRPVCGA